MSFGGYTRATWFIVLGVMLTCMWGFDKPEWAAYIGIAIAFQKEAGLMAAQKWEKKT